MTKIATTAVLALMLGTVLTLLTYVPAGMLMIGVCAVLLIVDIAYDAWLVKKSREADRPEDYCA